MFYNNIDESAAMDVALIDESTVEESIYNDFEEGALNAMAENESNYNALIEGIGLMETAVFQQEGTVVYTEGMVSSIWQNLKNFVVKVWQKIVALFKRFVAMFDQYFANDKNFVKKYRAKIVQADVKDLEYKGYTFPNLSAKVDSIDVGNAEALEEIIKGSSHAQLSQDNPDYDQDSSSSAGEQVEKALDKDRACWVGKDNGSVEAGEFDAELREHFYGSESAEDLDAKDMNLNDQLHILETTQEEDIKRVNKFKSKMEKVFNAYIKKLEDNKGAKAKEFGDKAAAGNKDSKDFTDAEKKASGEAQGVYGRNTSFATKYVHGWSAIETKGLGVVLNALKDRNRQARAICVKAMAKSGSFKESAAGSFDYPQYGDSFLTDIQFK